MLSQSSHSVSFESTFARELALTQVSSLATLLAADPSVDVQLALGALVLRMQHDSDQLDAPERDVLRALDERVAAALAQHPDPDMRDYASLLAGRADPEASRVDLPAVPEPEQAPAARG